MLQHSTLKFLRDLNNNNNKPWFDEHRSQFESTKTDFHGLVQQLITGISVFDPSIADLEPKNCTFRINRDVRFSKDKRPYKNNMGAYFNKAGKKGIGSGYYLHIQPGESFAAGGIWMPEATVLAKIRQEIDYNIDELKKLENNKIFQKYFPGGLESNDSLQRPPKGYDINNPALHYLKMKNYIVSTPFKDKDIREKGFVNEVTKSFKAMQPFIDFLNRAIE